MRCELCQRIFSSIKGLASHIIKTHKITTEDYYLQFNLRKPCPCCGLPTIFLDLNRGYRECCSVLCSNRHKATKQEYRQKLSISNKKVIKKKHSQETKEKISQNSKNFWSNTQNRQKMLGIFQSPSYRQKASKTSSELGFHAIRSITHGIRCDSSAESDFVNYCVENKIEIKRFVYRNKVSIKLGSHWRVPDFIINKNTVIDVKDFHVWFIDDFKNGLDKYIPIEKWCVKRKLKFLFWFQKYGFLSIEQLLTLPENEINFMIKTRGTKHRRSK